MWLMVERNRLGLGSIQEVTFDQDKIAKKKTSHKTHTHNLSAFDKSGFPTMNARPDLVSCVDT
jgi:hypothetical protein